MKKVALVTGLPGAGKTHFTLANPQLSCVDSDTCADWVDNQFKISWDDLIIKVNSFASDTVYVCGTAHNILDIFNYLHIFEVHYLWVEDDVWHSVINLRIRQDPELSGVWASLRTLPTLRGTQLREIADYCEHSPVVHVLVRSNNSFKIKYSFKP